MPITLEDLESDHTPYHCTIKGEKCGAAKLGDVETEMTVAENDRNLKRQSKC
jgi:hypothetical protein